MAAEDEDENLTIDDLPAIKKKYAPRLVICEGNSDQAVLNALLRVNGIGGVQVEFAKGVTNFPTMLRAARGMKFNWILLIADEDDEPETDGQFKKVQTALKEAGYALPAARREQVKPSGKNPGVEILMIPWDKEPGCMETVCLPAFKELYAAQYDCLDSFAACAGSDKWSVSKLSEMKVHCLLGSTQKQNPRIGLQIFANREKCPLNFKHDCFKRISDYLSAFSSLPV